MATDLIHEYCKPGYISGFELWQFGELQQLLINICNAIQQFLLQITST